MERQDAGGIVHLEHINLEVPDLELARLFYSEGLGLTLDPGTFGLQRGGAQVVWYNISNRQQFHIAKSPEGKGAQQLPQHGKVGLVLPDVPKIQDRLARLQQLLGPQASATLGEDGVLAVTDPFGVEFRIHPSYPNFLASRGIVYVRQPCYSGTAGQIADFYSRIFGAVTSITDSTGNGRVPASPTARISLGPGTVLEFTEQEELGAFDAQGVVALWSGWHVAFYISNFGQAYELCTQHNVIDNNHPYRDKCNSLQDALSNHQFRIRHVVRIDGDGESSPEGQAQPLACFGHEVRSLYHPRFLRPLYCRGDSHFDVPQ